jgi:predicted transcriptional regulator
MREDISDFAFSARDREIMTLMSSLGINKNMSKVVLFLSKNGEASSRAIENAVDLRQSEVSIVTSSLRRKGWLISRNLKKPGKGRPTNLFKLRYPLPKVIKDIETEKQDEMEEMRKMIAHLKRLAK